MAALTLRAGRLNARAGVCARRDEQQRSPGCRRLSGHQALV